MFASDRDLLVYEPNLFRDVAWVGQRLVKGTGTIAGTTLTMLTQDVTLAAAGVSAGHVVLVDGAPYEVIERLSATTATVSRLRVAKGDPVIPPSPVTNVAVLVWSMGVQIGMVHRQILRLAGIEVEASGEGAGPAESAIVNAAALGRLTALGALHLIYAAASAPGGGSSLGASAGILTRAEIYRRRYGEERARVNVEIDLDGDGLADATRRLNIAVLMRG